MKKIISTFAIFTTFSFAAMANAYDQKVADTTLINEHKSVIVSGDESASKKQRFAGLGGLFGNQQKGKVFATYQRSATSTRFVGLGGLFGNQDESITAIKIQEINVATSNRFPGLGGPLGGQRTAEFTLKTTFENVL